jgi:hypothetical protein
MLAEGGDDGGWGILLIYDVLHNGMETIKPPKE